MRLLAFTLLAVSCGARTGLFVADDGGEGGFGADGPGGSGSGAGGDGVGGVDQLALGAGHSCARTIAGAVFCWGRNGDGQLGDGTFVDSLVPVAVDLPAPAEHLAAGTFHTCAILQGGAATCWGDNTRGQLGIGTAGDSVATPTELPGGPYASLALGEQHSCAVGASGALFCWGSGSDGQNGFAGDQLFPAEVGSGVAAVAAGAFHTCFLDTTGTVRCMGSNVDGECGVSGVSIVLPPAVPFGLGSVTATSLASGIGHHSCIVDEGGAIHCWGDNDEAQLGLGFTSANELPTQLFAKPNGEVEVIAPGFAHTCALIGERVYCWGDNYSGQLGTGGPDASEPVLVSLQGARAVGSGTAHSCAYVSPTEMYCWGGNGFGQLGDGTTQPSPVPVPVKAP